MNFTFSGHESFQCRTLWLKKGYDYLKAGKDFNAIESVVDLGVGKNMVNAIFFWMKAFGLLNEDKTTTEFAKAILDDNGFDPFLERRSTLWLLHYQLVATQRASLYHYVFNIYRKQYPTLTKEFLAKALELHCNYHKKNISPNTLDTDSGVFIKNYYSPVVTKSIEDDCSGVFVELGLFDTIERNRENVYALNLKDGDGIDELVILYAISCLQEQGVYTNSISFDSLMNYENSPGTVFLLNQNGMMNKVQRIVKMFPKVTTYTDDAGIRELQFKKRFPSQEVLRMIYTK